MIRTISNPQRRQAMDIEALHAFCEVAQTNSFSEAAMRLHLTQPAVSKRIAALEQTLGAPLFDRVSRKISLTAAGKTLLPRAENILRELKEAKRAMSDLSGEVRGELKVATSHHLGLHKLPPIIRAFSQEFPRVNLQIEFLDSEVALNKVLKGKCELAVITLAPTPYPQLHLKRLWDDPLAFVCAKELVFEEAISLAMLSRRAAILPDLNTYTGRLVKQCFDRHKLPLNLNMATNYLETIKMMVSVGLGWSVLPESMVDGQIKKLKVPNVNLSRRLGVVHHEKRHLSNAAHAFYSMLADNSEAD